MFGRKKREEEQAEQTRKQEEAARKEQEIRQSINQMQAQLSKRAQEVQQLNKELEAAKADKKQAEATQRQLQAMQKEMAALQQRLKEAEAQSASAAPAPAPAVPQQPVTAPRPEGLAIGATAWVRKAGGKSLNRRSAPGLNSTVHDSLTIGTQMTLLEGPLTADGYTWWRMRTSDGREGWVAGEELVTQPE